MKEASPAKTETTPTNHPVLTGHSIDVLVEHFPFTHPRRASFGDTSVSNNAKIASLSLDRWKAK